jgi:hypothetical protein
MHRPKTWSCRPELPFVILAQTKFGPDWLIPQATLLTWEVCLIKTTRKKCLICKIFSLHEKNFRSAPLNSKAVENVATIPVLLPGFQKGRDIEAS